MSRILLITNLKSAIRDICKTKKNLTLSQSNSAKVATSAEMITISLKIRKEHHMCSYKVNNLTHNIHVNINTRE